MRRRAGFSLLELLVVLSLAALVATLGMPRLFQTLERQRFQAGVHIFVQTLERAKRQARARQQTVPVRFDRERLAYQLGERWRELPEGTEMGVRTLARDVDGEQAQLEFYPDGTSSGANISLVQEELHYRIDVNWLSGQIELQRDDG